MTKSILQKGSIIIISGPSGCGKSSLLSYVFKQIKNYYFSISTTTRALRGNETNGIDYFFVSKKDFKKGIKNNDFLEWANVHGNYYGTTSESVNEALRKNKIVIFDIDVEGHRILRKKLGNFCTSIFITTPSIAELEKRLTFRGTDSKKTIQQRIINSKKEIKHVDKYDYVVINDHFHTAKKQLLYAIESSRIQTKLFDKKDILKLWKKN